MSSHLLIPHVLFPNFFAVAYVRLRKNRDPDWEERWRYLSRRDRLRISSAARRGEMPSDPVEAELAAGSARQQRQVFSGGAIGPIINMVVAVVLMLAGIAQGSPLISAGGAALFGFAFWRRKRERNISRNLNRVERGD
jgi:hypothetical protein